MPYSLARSYQMRMRSTTMVSELEIHPVSTLASLYTFAKNVKIMHNYLLTVEFSNVQRLH